MSEIKNILLGVTGGIAAYKSAEIVSRLKKAGYEIRCVMTEGAQHFLTPLTLQTLSGHPVTTSMFSEPGEWQVEHIALAQWADLFLIAPATANIMGKIAHGIADDFLSTCVMATNAPVALAPAMNNQMYLNPINQRNMADLKALGRYFIDPIVGNLACGDQGQGKMQSPEEIVAFVQSMSKQDLNGIKILITAGPTQEAIDPVRYLTNHSSGKMGYSLAKRAVARGAEVTLVSGKTNLLVPEGLEFVPVVSARDMHAAVLAVFDEQDVVVKAAAVADYRPKIAFNQKIKKKDGDWQLLLERNPDILAELGIFKSHQILVGFAAETNDVEANALGKLQRKNLDMIVANDLTAEHSGFSVDTNQIALYSADGKSEYLPVMSKSAAADHILDRILSLWQEKQQG